MQIEQTQKPMTQNHEIIKIDDPVLSMLYVSDKFNESWGTNQWLSGHVYNQYAEENIRYFTTYDMSTPIMVKYLIWFYHDTLLGYMQATDDIRMGFGDCDNINYSINGLGWDHVGLFTEKYGSYIHRYGERTSVISQEPNHIDMLESHMKGHQCIFDPIKTEYYCEYDDEYNSYADHIISLNAIPCRLRHGCSEVDYKSEYNYGPIISCMLYDLSEYILRQPLDVLQQATTHDRTCEVCHAYEKRDSMLQMHHLNYDGKVTYKMENTHKYYTQLIIDVKNDPDSFACLCYGHHKMIEHIWETGDLEYYNKCGARKRARIDDVLRRTTR